MSQKMDFIWKKITCISFVLSVLVMCIHNTYSEACQLDEVGNNLALLVTRIIPSIAVPGFLIISGITFYRNYDYSKTKGKLLSRLSSLLIPYLAWNTIWMVFTIILTYSPFAGIAVKKELFVPNIQNILLGVLKYKYNVIYWYVFIIMILSCLAPLIFTLLRNQIWGGIAILILIIMYPFYSMFINNLGFRGDIFIWYFVGAYVGIHHFEKLKLPVTNKMAIIFGILCLMSVVVLSKMNINNDSLSVLEVLLVFMYVVAFWFFSDIFVKRITIKKVMTISFVIYSTHMNIQSIFVKIYGYILPGQTLMLIPGYIVTIFLTIGVILIFSYVGEKYFSKPWMLITGGHTNQIKK